MLLLLYWMWSSENLDGLNGGGWGRIYSPNHYSSRCCRWHTGQSGGVPNMALFIVRCVPHQLTVGVWSGWPLKSFVLLRHRTVRWHTGPSGVFWLCSSDFWPLRWPLFTVHRSRPLGTVDRCSVSSPYMSGAHRTIQWIIAEWLWKNPRAASSWGASA
jgi:hypothetical protein